MENSDNNTFSEENVSHQNNEATKENEDKVEENEEEKEEKECFSEPDDFSDIIFDVENKKIHFNKSWLAMQSPVFKAMLYGHYKEKDAKDIALPNKKYKEMITFFKMMHPDYTDLILTGKCDFLLHNR